MIQWKLVLLFKQYLFICEIEDFKLLKIICTLCKRKKLMRQLKKKMTPNVNAQNTLESFQQMKSSFVR